MGPTGHSRIRRDDHGVGPWHNEKEERRGSESGEGRKGAASRRARSAPDPSARAAADHRAARTLHRCLHKPNHRRRLAMPTSTSAAPLRSLPALAHGHAPSTRGPPSFLKKHPD